nr:hypothetical protein [Nocardioides convexus]
MSLADDTTLTGRIGDSDEEAVSVDVDGAERRVPYADVRKALVQIEFNRKTSDDEKDAE